MKQTTILVATMAIITYLIRLFPLLSVRTRVRSPFLRSFLHYIPYAVLAAMTFPAILYGTPSLISALAGLAVALLLAFCRFGLVTVAAGSVAIVWIVEQFLL